ncbi:hypothetical protein [Rhodococcoides fascians]|uniref:hypothetical protein n=1 Tax=Rhodococcoides fascians TaxID=1828 RepID=UPI00050CB2C1|nr:hypothetical protein [Rhodococcus fascians]
MAEYTVSWQIQIEAENPTEAARAALRIHRNPESTATCFTVTDEKGAVTGRCVEIDLDEVDAEDEVTPTD